MFDEKEVFLKSILTLLSNSDPTNKAQNLACTTIILCKIKIFNLAIIIKRKMQKNAIVKCFSTIFSFYRE